jgi:hypothetical protein
LFYAGRLHEFNVVDADLWRVRFTPRSRPVELTTEELRATRRRSSLDAERRIEIAPTGVPAHDRRTSRPRLVCVGAVRRSSASRQS